MENTVLDYCLVRERSPDEFEAKIKEMIRLGFVPQGGVSCGAEYGGGRMFYQAMVKFKPVSPQTIRVRDIIDSSVFEQRL